MSKQTKIKTANRHAIGMKTSVLIGTPTPLDGSINNVMATFCTNAVSRGIADWRTVPSRDAENGRNVIIKDFLAENPVRHTHLFFLDADTAPYDPFAIEMLLKHRKPVIAGITGTKREPPNWPWLWNVVIMKDGRETTIRRHPCDPNKDTMPMYPFLAHSIGGTTILLQRSVLEKLTEPYQMTVRRADGSLRLSEDYYFCQKIRDAGFELWVDPSVRCAHFNNVDITKDYYNYK